MSLNHLSGHVGGIKKIGAIGLDIVWHLLDTDRWVTAIYIYLYVLATNLRKSGVIEVNKKNGLNLSNLVRLLQSIISGPNSKGGFSNNSKQHDSLLFEIE